MKRSVWCESEVERRFFSRLDQMREVLYYQEQPLSIRYKLNKQPRTYHPDALVVFTDGTSVLTEVKQTRQLVDFENIVKYAAMLERCEAEGWGAFIGDCDEHLKAIVHHKLNRRLNALIRTELKSREISGEWLKRIKERMSVKARDVNAAFLQLELVVESSPFRARQAQPKERAAIAKVLRYFGKEWSKLPASGTRSRASNRAMEAEASPSLVTPRAAAQRGRSSHSATARLQHPNAYRPWTRDEERWLLSSYASGMPIPIIAERLGRNAGAIRSRLRRLNVDEAM